jgi:hypothetical protein
MCGSGVIEPLKSPAKMQNVPQTGLEDKFSADTMLPDDHLCLNAWDEIGTDPIFMFDIDWFACY